MHLSIPCSAQTNECIHCLQIIRQSSPDNYRGDHKQPEKRKPIAAKLIAGMLEVAGVNQVITVDIHSPQTEGFFSIPVDCLTARFLFERSVHLTDSVGERKEQSASPASPVNGLISLMSFLRPQWLSVLSVLQQLWETWAWHR